MAEMSGIGKLLMLAGAVVFLAGVAVTFSDRIPFLGRLPGDIQVQKGSTTFYFPVVTCLVLSVVGSLVLWLISKR